MSSDTNIKYVESTLRIHTFSKNIYGTDIQFSVLKMKDSVFIWVGFDKSRRFSELNLAIQGKYGKTPLSTHLLGSSSDIISKMLTSKLSKRLEKPVFLSYNVQDNQLTTEIVRTLMDEIKASPLLF